jgi:ATP-dependent Clp protease ATP-binding subunit ClpB
VERRITQLEIEREALRKETDAASQERLTNLEKELADLKEESGRLKGQWQREKEAIQGLQQLKEESERVRHEVEQAERVANYELAARLKYETLTGLEKRIKDSEETLVAQSQGSRMLKEEVDEEDIAEVVSRWTGIPVSRLMEARCRNYSTWSNGCTSG